ncbi:chromate efflux transporter [Nitrosovibrio sp. Nv6]|uniref:chromate efflux transporter n=1 Tax=Nitrosovibrio sp. Nv6 TaxID=1855340 RepID=UPI0008B29FD6|nr:chromate efflux transporter [Nitrosovibrio sp. Nv6]SEO58872.1 chromate transporter [Nitrosovibrio sp. Nv6]
MQETSDTGSPEHQHWGEILHAFLKLGLTSFGGPIAHLGYFRDELVTRRRWISESGYADLVALCQFLPGPASSQVGFALGLSRGGFVGALIALTAFTLPSALLLLVFAYSASAFEGLLGHGLIHGLKLVAVAVVAQAVCGMARNLCPDRARASIAAGAVLIVVFLPGALGQMSAIISGAIAGLWLCKNLPITDAGHLNIRLSKSKALLVSLIFFVLLIALPLIALTSSSQAVALFEAFYRAGALVFGGGHVVLPLLEASVVETGWIDADSFLAGYGAAQAVPGPLFTFAAYLGAVVSPEPNGILGAVICLIAIFLPGMLLLAGVLPFWDDLRKRSGVQAAMAGANSAVVGILAAALYDPVWTSAILIPPDFAVAFVAFILLTVCKVSPWKVVLLSAMAGAGLSLS